MMIDRDTVIVNNMISKLNNQLLIGMSDQSWMVIKNELRMNIGSTNQPIVVTYFKFNSISSLMFVHD